MMVQHILHTPNIAVTGVQEVQPSLLEVRCRVLCFLMMFCVVCSFSSVEVVVCCFCVHIMIDIT